MHGFVERVAPHGKLNVDLKASASGGTEDGRELTHHEPDMRIGPAGHRLYHWINVLTVNHKVARFRQVNMTDPHAHHDALEFPDGQIVKVTRLVAGQTATVLQLPASTLDHKTAPQSPAARTIEV